MTVGPHAQPHSPALQDGFVAVETRVIGLPIWNSTLAPLVKRVDSGVRLQRSTVGP